jgi:predicted dehydrogenase
MSEKLSALLIGCGKIGGGLNKSPDDKMVLTHALAFSRHPGFSLAACVEPDTAARKEFMSRWNIPNGFSSTEEALESGISFKVASLACPTEKHIEQLELLAKSPIRAVFAEKPLGGDAKRAQQIVEKYEKLGKPLLVAYLRRFDSAMTGLRDEISKGVWGEVRKAIAIYGRGVVNNGTHAVDLIRYVTGDRPLEIVSVNGMLQDGVAGDPTVDATLKLQNGALFHLAGVDASRHGVFEIALECSEGLISIEESGLKLRRRLVGVAPPIENVPRLLSAEAIPTGYGDAFLRALDDMLEALRSGKRPASDGRSALPAIEICDALRRRVL